MGNLKYGRLVIVVGKKNKNRMDFFWAIVNTYTRNIDHNIHAIAYINNTFIFATNPNDCVFLSFSFQFAYFFISFTFSFQWILPQNFIRCCYAFDDEKKTEKKKKAAVTTHAEIGKTSTHKYRVREYKTPKFVPRTSNHSI